MRPIDIHIAFGAPLAKWRRTVGSLTPREILAKIWHRMTAKLFLCYRAGLAVAFRLRNLWTRDAPIHAQARGVPFQMIPQGAVAFHTWSGLRFESSELAFILRVLKPGTTFFDVGANAGLFSLAAGKKLYGQSSSIFAFEPCPSTFAILQKNLQLNDLTQVRAMCSAISESTGECELFVNAQFKDALNSLQPPSHTDADVVARVRVPTITLDEFVARENIPQVDVMKVDVEGAELLVFRGGSRLLRRPDAPLILYEGYSWCTAGFHYHPVELMWLLESFGYELFVLDSVAGRVRRRSPGESYDAMVVAVKPEHPSFHDVALSGASA